MNLDKDFEESVKRIKISRENINYRLAILKASSE
jgi:hypothetical protein